MKEFEEPLLKIHIYKNDLLNLDRTSLLAAQAIAYALRTGNVKPVDRGRLSFNFLEARDQILAENKRRVEVEMALRVARIRLAKRIIDENKDLQQKLLAVFAMDQDLKIINDFVEQQRQGLFQLIDEPDIDQINRTVEEAQQNAPRLFRDAERLFTGIHWWLRGRYGKGSVANGLLKGAYVKNNPAAGFALNVPRNRPVATDPFRNEGVPRSPYVARRHENTWAWENGGISMKMKKLLKLPPYRTTFTEARTCVHGTVSVFGADFDEPDPSDAYQIVGYQEYANALNNLVPLVREADEHQ